MEPKPLSENNIQLVNEMPLNSFLSQDLLQNCQEYTQLLKATSNMAVASNMCPTTAMPTPLALPSLRQQPSLLRSVSVPGLATPKGGLPTSFGNIPCPKVGISRGSSDTSIMSTGSNGDMVHIYDYQQERWMDRYHQLAAYFQQHGNSDVSNEYDANLAGWVRRQRHQFKRAKQGRRSTLTVARVQLLERVGYTWDFHDVAWNKNFEQLKAFYRIHKHTNVPTSCSSNSEAFGMTKEENDRLLNWCKRQKRAIRMYLKDKNAVGSRMNAKRFELLQSIGFRWQPVKKVESPAAA